MAVQVAASMASTCGVVSQHPSGSCFYHGGVEIDQLAVVGAVALRGADAMWIVADIAGCSVFGDVLAVILERVGV